MIIDLINTFYEKNEKKLNDNYYYLILNSGEIINYKGIFLFLSKNLAEFIFLYSPYKKFLSLKSSKKFFYINDLSRFNIFVLKIILKNMTKKLDESIEPYFLNFFMQTYEIFVTSIVVYHLDNYYFFKKAMLNFSNFFTFLKKNDYL